MRSIALVDGPRNVLYSCWGISIQNREARFIDHSLETKSQRILSY